MLNENIQNLRKQKGMTQEELAIRLHVVRQTVSKWEKGISTPDAQMLQRIAQELETDVSTLLGSPVEAAPDLDGVSQQLAKINEQLAIRNRRWRTFWKVVIAALLVLFLVSCSVAIGSGIAFQEVTTHQEVETVVMDD